MKINELHPGEKQKFDPSNTDYERSYDKFLLECSDSIAAMKQANGFLYRGIKATAPSIFVGSPRQDRKPVDSNLATHEDFGKIMTKAGFVARRDNSIFCTGSVYETGYYGKSYIIFPKNGFQFTWSQKIDDLTRWMTTYLTREFKRIGFYAYSDTFKKYRTAGFNITSYTREVLHEVNKLPYGSPERKAGEKLYHVISDSEGYYKTDPETNAWSFPNVKDSKKILAAVTAYNSTYKQNVGEKLLAQLPNYIQYATAMTNPGKNIPATDVMKGMEYRTDDFAAAIDSRKEIMIKGEYYAFSKDKYEYQLNRNLLNAN